MSYSPNSFNTGLITDLYQLTMNAAYFDSNKHEENATFEMFIRSLPPDWGYFIAAGIDQAIDQICQLKFSEEDISFLNDLGLFSSTYLEFLHRFSFDGDIFSLKEGTPFTAETPIIRVTAKRPVAQLLETIILTIVNFPTLIASKASRIVNAAGESAVIDFGLRRAHGIHAGIEGARASYLAGTVATSNVEAARIYGIPPSGTMAHSFVMSFRDEIDAFRAYSDTFLDRSVFVVDTYDTLEGARVAAKVGKEMEQKGYRLKGVRLDSGNLGNLSKKVRDILDGEGLEYVEIVLSSDLNEYKIEKLKLEGSPVDSYGVGTEMITAKPIAALSGVYKLVEDSYGPRIKLSDGKRTHPGKKQVYRLEDDKGRYLYDILELEGENCEGLPLLEPVVLKGKRIRDAIPLVEARAYCLECVSRLPMETKKVKTAKPYQQKIGPRLQELTRDLTKKYSRR
jgi:nicotinate phosphoribosyltransferase